MLGEDNGSKKDHSGKSRVTYKTRALVSSSFRIIGTIDKGLDISDPGSIDENKI